MKITRTTAVQISLGIATILVAAVFIAAYAILIVGIINQQ